MAHRRVVISNRNVVRILFVWILLCSSALAVDGEVYFGKFNPDTTTARAYPDGGVCEYIAGIEVGQKINRFRPYLKIETIMDDYENSKFHPASIRYDIGLDINAWKGMFLELKHSCWHPVDRGGTVEQYDLFLLKYKFN